MGTTEVGARSGEDRSTRGEFLPLALGAWVVGVVVVGLMLSISLVVMVSVQNVTGTGIGEGWPAWGVAATGVLSLLFATFVGVWLFRMRRWIGTKGDPEDLETVRRKRRYFVTGAMAAYVPLAPCVCLLMVALANST